jgi:chromosome partitioning protein
MKVLAVLSQKGGVGKTTLATCLAVAAEQAGERVAIIDIDPQATASFWKDVRDQETPAVISVQPIRLGAMVKACADAETDLVIIDGAAVARDVTFEATKHADFVIVPTKTAVFDTMSMTHTLDVVREQKKPFAVVLTFVPPQGQETRDAISAIAELGAAVCPVTIGNRKAFFRAQAEGKAVQEFEPSGVAADEIKRLYDYTRIALYNDKKVKNERKLAASGA